MAQREGRKTHTQLVNTARPPAVNATDVAIHIASTLAYVPSWTASQLHDFRQVAEAGGFAAAFPERKERNRAYSSLRRLEVSLGALSQAEHGRLHLLTRGGHELTQAGEKLLLLAPQYVEAHSLIKAWLSGEESGPLIRVGGYPAHAKLINSVREVTEASGVALSERLIDASRGESGLALARDLAAKRLDIAILPSASCGQFEVLSARSLYRWYLCAVVGLDHRWHSTKDDVLVGDLVDEHLVLSPSGHASRLLLERSVDGIVEPAFESSSTDVVIEMALEARMVAVVPSDAIPLKWLRRDNGNLGRIIPIVNAEGARIYDGYVVAYDRNDDREEVLAVIEALVRDLPTIED